MDLGPPSFGGPRRAPSAPRPKRAAGFNSPQYGAAGQV
jgi:hypothetical protein